jgi:hypothetical protein
MSTFFAYSPFSPDPSNGSGTNGTQGGEQPATPPESHTEGGTDDGQVGKGDDGQVG